MSLTISTKRCVFIQCLWMVIAKNITTSIKELKKKDWTGDRNSVFKTLGASNHTDKEREANDFYATDPIAIDALVKHYDLPKHVWECACGEGHLAERLKELDFIVFASDLIDRGYGLVGIDFLKQQSIGVCRAIVTNPPYNKALQFILHALEILREGGVVAMFLKTTFLEGQQRYERLYSKYPPRYILQFSKRVLCAKNADFEGMKRGGGSAVAYMWAIWERGYKGETIVKWI